MARVRDQILALAALQRHHVVLDLNLGTGLLTWEALRQAPEGRVYACVRTTAEAEQIAAQIAVLPELERPLLLEANSLSEVPQALTDATPEIRFDRIVGRNALISEPDKAGAIRQLTDWLQPQGKIVLAETIPQQTQRLYRLLDGSRLTEDLYQRWLPAEEAIYDNAADPRVNWQAEDLQTAFEIAGLRVELQVEQTQTSLRITPSLLERWFTAGVTQPSYADHLAQRLSKTDIVQIKAAFHQFLGSQTVQWHSTIVFVRAWRPLD